ncbi:fagellar hook-basal body protein [Desulfurobacterium thermolithotrophum DSM 11699]|uniref:Flagellar hook protein FlgE n=1 Tax=Desulfurobacterium thermolithotrophum (strain DSM 11699 / BSA) TaxID=868864 RepID=F0S0R9_DESTD|nr:flagellar hook protein FlgE [Desulfurobacterium thermolithotrophum]ADY73872.1 fagellar hook-basal body protein [Desulfurobacterium thermolithotrophum DSM 11699]
MLQSFYTAFTGLNADKTWLSVISDNIANVNTVGFKKENAVFEDLLARSLTTFKNGAPVNQEIGGGTFISTTVKDFSQGTFMNTNNPLDLALDGEGFFMVKDETGVTYYTRNGEFRLDANGDLINMLGMKVQGWMLDEQGNLAGAVGAINIPMDMPPKETTEIKFESPSNLDSRVEDATKMENDKAEIGSNFSHIGFDPSEANSYSYINTVTIYDSLGNPHSLSYYFQKVDGNTWRVYSTVDGAIVPIKLKFADNTINDNLYSYIEFQFDDQGKLITDSLKAGYQVSYKYDTDITKSAGEFDVSGLTAAIGSLHIKKIQKNNDEFLVNFHDSGVVRTITVDVGGTTETHYIGNILDSNGNIVGEIDYTSGKITFDDASIEKITLDYVEPVSSGATLTGTVDNPVKCPITTSYDTMTSPDVNNKNTIDISSFWNDLKQVASDFIFYAQQDGNSKGDIMSVAVSEDGTIRATYTNGKVKDIARLAVATFKDKEMLVRKGNWLYVPNVQTFTPVIMPGGVISKVRSGMLEMSNVDIASEFINLITAQRAYQANARVITTDDQILQETMNIKR